VASSRIKLLLIKTTNRQYSVSPQFHHAAHGYTLSEEEGSTLVREGAARGYYVKDGVTKREGPLVRVQRGSIGPVLRLPVEVEWGGWCGDEAVCTYEPDMFYDESGTLLPDTVSPFEMGLEPAEIWRLINYYKLYCESSAQEESAGKSSSMFQRMYEELRDSVLKRAVAALELQERRAAAVAEKARHAKKTTSSAYWIEYFKKADAEREEALAALQRAVTGEMTST
jgi:hypothetical protein